MSPEMLILFNQNEEFKKDNLEEEFKFYDMSDMFSIGLIFYCLLQNILTPSNMNNNKVYTEKKIGDIKFD